MKNFRLNLFLRVIIFSVTVFFLFYILQFSDLKTTVIILGVLSLYQIYSLAKYIDETNREISSFLFSIKYSDFSQTFNNHRLGNSFKELNNSFNEVIQKFQIIRTEKEEHYRYLNTVMQHVGVGLLSFDEDGQVEFINNSAKRLLKIKYLSNIRSLEKVQLNLSDKLINLQPGHRTTLKLTDDNEILQLILNSTEFRMRGKLYKLISFQNIHIELEEKEIDAWQKLIRVLTHEIMNSVTPISSLAGTVENMLTEQFALPSKPSSETVKDIKDALNTIQKRSHGLIEFVDKYRSLAKIPKPNIQKFSVEELFNSVKNLMQSEIDRNDIDFSLKILPNTIQLFADQEQIEQVLLNLVINSIHAVKGSQNPLIELLAYYDPYRKVNIVVKDNGKGISQDIQEKIFIPFFTTKSEGSGIGLSLSRQIIRAHGGTIRVSSKELNYTSFIINL